MEYQQSKRKWDIKTESSDFLPDLKMDDMLGCPALRNTFYFQG